jgi:hypothetical protein
VGDPSFLGRRETAFSIWMELAFSISWFGLYKYGAPLQAFSFPLCWVWLRLVANLVAW